MSYVDGCIIPVPTANKTAYIKYATKIDAIFKKYGATNVVETWGHDVPDGKVTSFPIAVKLKPDETVVFSWIIWPDHETREKGFELAMAEVMADKENNQMPFDGQRMIYGGFDMILNT